MCLERGFLSDLTSYTKQVHAAFPGQFSMVNRVSDLGQRVLLMVDKRSPGSGFVWSSVLFMRGLQTLQGAILMADRGMNLEARTLTRSVFESAFYLAAIIKDVKFRTDFFSDYEKRMHVMSNALIALAKKLKDDTSLGFATRTKGEVNQAGDAAYLAMEQVAQRGGLSAVYASDYRGLSSDAAHPTPMSLNSHFKVDTNNDLVGLRWGPDVGLDGSYEHTLPIIAWAGIILIDQMNSLIDDGEVRIELAACYELYKQYQQHLLARD